MDNIYISIFLTAAIMYLLRVLPLTLIQKPIQNPFVRSFLYYVPYVTLADMTFPSMIDATGNRMAGAAALLVGVAMAWMGQSLIKVAAACCAAALVVGML